MTFRHFRHDRWRPDEPLFGSRRRDGRGSLGRDRPRHSRRRHLRVRPRARHVCRLPARPGRPDEPVEQQRLGACTSTPTDNLWVGTEDGGLNLWRAEARQRGEARFEHYGKDRRSAEPGRLRHPVGCDRRHLDQFKSRPRAPAPAYRRGAEATTSATACRTTNSTAARNTVPPTASCTSAASAASPRSGPRRSAPTHIRRSSR